MKFWEKHTEEMRKARLLQASAVIYSASVSKNREGVIGAVGTALALEAELNKQLKRGTNKGENS